jgi:class 3 adenylate cyclase
MAADHRQSAGIAALRVDNKVLGEAVKRLQDCIRKLDAINGALNQEHREDLDKIAALRCDVEKFQQEFHDARSVTEGLGKHVDELIHTLARVQGLEEAELRRYGWKEPLPSYVAAMPELWATRSAA